MVQEVLEVLEKNKQMKIIVPMAGRGSRLRPHTLTIPKPLVPVAGVPIVEQLVRDIAGVVDQPIEEVAFVLGDPAFFGDEIVEQLLKIAFSINGLFKLKILDTFLSKNVKNLLSEINACFKISP